MPLRAAVPGMPRNFRRIRELAATQSHTITLGQLMRSTRSDPPSLIQQGKWLHKQLPIRFARRLDEFLQLPYVIVKNSLFRQVLDIYLETFDSILEFPDILTPADEAAFCGLISVQLTKQKTVANMVAKGYDEVRRMYPNQRLDEFLDRFFIMRISSRILMENYVGMRSPQDGFVGVVRKELKPLSVAEALVADITSLTKSIYGIAPQVVFRGNIHCTLDYIPQHVRFMLQEMLKNAIRATVERHLQKHATGASAPELPAVVVELQKGDFHVIIKVSDHGGGMPKHVQREVWKYGWTSAGKDEEATQGDAAWGKLQAHSMGRELAGFGFGLPLTRLHAQYFGGDVFMQALPGHGTDMYLLLNHLQEGTPSTEDEDPSTMLTQGENLSSSTAAP